MPFVQHLKRASNRRRLHDSLAYPNRMCARCWLPTPIYRAPNEPSRRIRGFAYVRATRYWHIIDEPLAGLALKSEASQHGRSAVLKPGGILVIADHSARAGDGASVGKTFHRIEESALRREVEAVGFKLVAEGDFWRHPEDPRDFSIQPPSGRAVDEFVLKFQKSM